MEGLAHTGSGRRGLLASQLAGLHVHFYLATVLQGRKDDVGCYITSAEWMDVNYGSLVRQLLLDGLGGQVSNVLDPKAAPFADVNHGRAPPASNSEAGPRA